MAVETIDPNPRPFALTRAFDLARVRWEVVAYTLIIIASVMAHLWGLDRMALHHDESIHAWSSWRLYTGAGGFNCWSGVEVEGQPRIDRVSPTYCYDPVYHGPSLYYFTALAYFLFGDGDAQARLPMAVAGMLLVASAWWLRPYVGRGGALVAALLLGFTPALLYYTRFARHDGLMVLWELWMFIGALRWLDTGKARWLYLTAVAIALAIATHELYYILFFIFGVFVLMRLLAESRFARYLNFFLLGVMALALVLMVFNPRIPVGQGLYFGEKAFLVATAFLLAWLCQSLWEPQPILIPRLQELWRERRETIWIALGMLFAIYLVFYSSFFIYMRGALDGLYAGLAYWLGSQQEYARGDQPWYYYLILLPLYDPLAFAAGIGTVVAMIVAVAQRLLAARKARVPEASAEDEQAPAAEASIAVPAKPWPLYSLLTVFWFWTALIIFSWAGEKMPWLVVHMALPGNLLMAWVVAKMIEAARPTPLAEDGASEGKPLTWATIWLVPALTSLIGVAVSVALWRLGETGAGQEAQRNFLQGLVPLLIAGGLIYWLLTLAHQLGARQVAAVAGLTLVVLVGAYTMRATWLVVYTHPDTAIEPMIYTQTAPDVPRHVADVRELAINLTRGSRTPQDVTGGLSMPIIVDSGGPSGEGSLAWPLQWYFRDFQRVAWTKREDFQTNPTQSTFETQMPDGTTVLAPVVMLYKPHVTTEVRNVLSEAYVQPYGPASIFNWWFPEGDKCSPQSPGYKRFYYSTWTPRAELEGTSEGGGCGRDISAEVYGPFEVLRWPFRRENWGTLGKYVLYRELPYPLVPGAREMEFWLRRDLAAGVGDDSTMGSGTTGAAPSLRLVAQQVAAGPLEGGNPTGAAVDANGNLYVADTGRHQIHVFSATGELVRTIGGFGNEPGQLYEPRGLAVDSAGNLYVADTWNARVVKYDPEGQVMATWGSGESDLADGRRATITDGDPARNEANPLGFFGPRGIAVDNEGRVYLADTGNRRIVVTDDTGTFLYQFGGAGSELGQFNEPTGVAVDARGNVFVADIWNGRVQVFTPDGSGRVSSIPLVTWRISGWNENTYDDPSIAVSAESTVFVSVPTSNQVLAFNLRGDPLLRWGGPGEDLASLNGPSGMAVDADGGVWVTDRLSGRVLYFVLPAIQMP
ncbi:flippase activity-associated protein Agl23 [Candidatus Chloroploca sp. Khr17]|uniref:flippase activity-associated protein Agl23 n=1 Tax=Candidatus Chloroploca sp. Khr17 TaxID=2496869 RepID=UPI00101BE18E|nr:flippase activity-associated protein Agl23 [Candidatus Chloroploca sp. Khr17]